MAEKVDFRTQREIFMQNSVNILNEPIDEYRIDAAAYEHALASELTCLINVNRIG